MPRELNVIGKKLRKLRKEKKFKLSELEAKCGVLGWDVTGNTLAKIESMQRSVFDCELIILSKVLGIQICDLYPAKVNDVKLRECLNKPARR